jgi:hypothetical protein
MAGRQLEHLPPALGEERVGREARVVTVGWPMVLEHCRRSSRPYGVVEPPAESLFDGVTVTDRGVEWGAEVISDLGRRNA